MQAAVRYIQRPGVSAAMGRVLSTHPLHPDATALLRSSNLELITPFPSDTLPLPLSSIQSLASRCGAMIAFMPDTVNLDFIESCPHLKIVSGALRGPDNFDVPALTKSGIWFTRCGDLLTNPTAELGVGLAIGLGRNLLQGDSKVRSGTFASWRPELFGAGLDGATIGILGLGAVGRALVPRLQGFGVSKILYLDTPSEMTTGSAAAWVASQPPHTSTLLHPAKDLLALMAASDVVFPLTPLSPTTRHVINRQALAAARPHTLVVNVGRGGCVDEEAVAEALVSGSLGGYAADVFEMEDWAIEGRRKDIPLALRRHSRTLFTPHLGSAVKGARRAIDLEAAENVVDVLVRGVRPRGAINTPVMQ